jgi:hypothetical protein
VSSKEKTAEHTPSLGSVVIAVVSAGWVFVGRLAAETSEYVRLDQASTIRRWGTRRGLGELTLVGPLKETVLDPVGSAWIQRQHLLFLLPCRRDVWDERLP